MCTCICMCIWYIRNDAQLPTFMVCLQSNCYIELIVPARASRHTHRHRLERIRTVKQTSNKTVYRKCTALTCDGDVIFFVLNPKVSSAFSSIWMSDKKIFIFVFGCKVEWMVELNHYVKLKTQFVNFCLPSFSFFTQKLTFTEKKNRAELHMKNGKRKIYNKSKTFDMKRAGAAALVAAAHRILRSK